MCDERDTPYSLIRAGHDFRSGLGLAEAFREMDPHRTGEIRFDRVLLYFRPVSTASWEWGLTSIVRTS